MREHANWPLVERLSQNETHDSGGDTTRNRLLADKKAKQLDYMVRDRENGSVEAMGHYWTEYADQSLNHALRASWGETKQASRFIPADMTEGEPVPGLFVLGLGKLGGFDLNFSSDVDLVAFYDADSVPVPAFVGRTDITARVLRTFT